MSESKHKNWCVTHNNYSEAQLDEWKTFPALEYIVIGQEVAPETGTHHLQITLRFSTRRTFSAVKKVLARFGNPHIEVCKDLFASIAYCKKEGIYAIPDYVPVWTEHGTYPKTPADGGTMEQNRWATALVACKEGRFDDIPPQIQITQCRNLEYVHLRHLAAQPLADTTEKHRWYCGPSGSGKSRKAREEFPDAYLKMCNKWWDHYQGEETALVEDFDKAHAVLCHHLKIWADRYPFLAEGKGTTRKLRPKLLIVTSNYHPEEIWSEPSDLEPILRRFHVTRFNSL